MTLRTATFWIAAACCVIAELAILRSLLFGRAAAAGRSIGAAGAHPRTKRATEIAWALLPAAGLLVVLYLTWRAVDAPQTRSATAAESGVTIGV